MFLAFRMSPAAIGRGLCDIDNSELLNHVSKIGKSWQDENMRIIWVFLSDL